MGSMETTVDIIYEIPVFEEKKTLSLAQESCSRVSKDKQKDTTTRVVFTG